MTPPPKGDTEGVSFDEMVADRVPTGENEDASAAVYARTSSTSREFGYSIDEQIRRCWQRCEQLGWEVDFVFTDEAQSGRDTDRPQFQRLLDAAESEDLDVVVFWKLDRFCRSLVDLVNIEDQLSEWNVALHSVTEHIDTTTAVGRFNFRNLASAAELESDLTAQRVKLGMYGLAQDRKWPNDQPPLGYDMADDGTLVVNKEEAELVYRIFELYVKERSMPDVAFQLNERDETTKQGERWTHQSVRKVLGNEVYVGKYQVAGVEDNVEAYRILPDELFEEVTEIRYRFQHSKEEMNQDRKQAKGERILTQYKQVRGQEKND